MLKYAEALETMAIILLGIILLIVVKPVSTEQLIFAGILAGLVIFMTAFSVWEGWRHRR